MNIDLKFVDLTADVLEIFCIKYVYMYTYNCDFFFCFRSYLFVHALLARAPLVPTHISSAVTLREV